MSLAEMRLVVSLLGGTTCMGLRFVLKRETC